jgi:riboflavin kinase
MHEMLLELAKRNAMAGVTLTTQELGEILKCSQQTASRKLIDLENNGFIKKERAFKGQKIILTPQGMEVLRTYYIQLKSIFEEREAVIIKGELISGMGEGKYYISQEGYIRQFKKKLGFIPYPGTLNIKLEHEHDLKIREMLENCPHIQVEGFNNENRTFGAVKCYPVLIEGIRGAILTPLRTHHPLNVIEIIAPLYLRDKLDLKDGDKITVKVSL